MDKEAITCSNSQRAVEHKLPTAGSLDKDIMDCSGGGMEDYIPQMKSGSTLLVLSNNS